MEVGHCYLITTPPNGKHWFVVAFPISESRYLLLPFTTRRPKSDLSCVIEPGAHALEFIEHSSVIGYRDAIELTTFAFEDATKRGHCTPAGQVKKSTLEHILRSGLASKFLKNKWKTVIREILKDSE